MYSLILFALINAGTLTVKSPSFGSNEMIPSMYTCEGKEINPPLVIEGLPTAAKSMVLIVDDPDTDHGTFDHWVVWNINPTKIIMEDGVPGIEGKNGSGKKGYKGPCPPSGTHRYFFKVYALDTILHLDADAGKKEVEAAMADHIIARGELVGLYKKSRK